MTTVALAKTIVFLSLLRLFALSGWGLTSEAPDGASINIYGGLCECPAYYQKSGQIKNYNTKKIVVFLPLNIFMSTKYKTTATDQAYFIATSSATY